VLKGIDRMLAAYYCLCRQIAVRSSDQVVDSNGTQTLFFGSNAYSYASRREGQVNGSNTTIQVHSQLDQTSSGHFTRLAG